jgi:hypothetical protein
MNVRVVIPPSPIVEPVHIAGSHAADDAAVAAMIQAVTEEIDGPSGWLGRSLGAQLLVLSLECWPSKIRLPYGPVTEISNVEYIDVNDEYQTVEPELYGLADGYFWFRSGWSEPALGEDPFPVQILYSAGYTGGLFNAVPERARQAIILSVQHLKSLAVESLYLRADEVEGIGRREYTLSDQASKVVQMTCERLLQGLKVYYP